MARQPRYEVKKHHDDRHKGFFVLDTLTGEWKVYGLPAAEQAILKRNEFEARNDRARGAR